MKQTLGIAVALSFLSGCGHGQTVYVEKAALAAEKLAFQVAETIEEHDLEWQKALEARPDARAAIAKYRAARDRVRALVRAVAAAASLADLNLAALERGVMAPADFDRWVAGLLAFARELSAALTTVQGGPPE